MIEKKKHVHTNGKVSKKVILYYTNDKRTCVALQHNKRRWKNTWNVQNIHNSIWKVIKFRPNRAQLTGGFCAFSFLSKRRQVSKLWFWSRKWYILATNSSFAQGFSVVRHHDTLLCFAFWNSMFAPVLTWSMAVDWRHFYTQTMDADIHGYGTSSGCGLPLYGVHAGRGRTLSCLYSHCMPPHTKMSRYTQRVSFAIGRRVYGPVHNLPTEHRE